MLRLQGIPEAIKQKIIAAAGSGAMQMGVPKGASGMPAIARAMMDALFRSWFTNAVASTFVVAVIIAVVGGLCAFLLRSHVQAAGEPGAGPEFDAHLELDLGTVEPSLAGPRRPGQRRDAQCGQQLHQRQLHHAAAGRRAHRG